MAWPSLPDYNAALSRAPSTLIPLSLQGFRVVNGPLGLPMPVSGGYAYIYELRTEAGKRKALRCFREDDRVRRTRAAAACRNLASALSGKPDLARHFIRADWEEQCLRCEGGPVPAMVMDWAEGRTLGAYLEAVQDDRANLRDLRGRLAGMLGLLAAAGIVHGDLQAGNILVGPDGTPVLIDYDGMRFPGAPPGPSAPDAHPHFQHPEWDDSCDPSLKDRFPSIALDLGLAALAEDPRLFPRFSTGENVLFRAEDYAEPDSSPVFAAVRALPPLARAAELLAGLALGPVSGLPTLEEFRAEAWKERPGAAAPAPAKPAPHRAPAAYRGVYEVFAAEDYEGIEEVVGEKVEVVGRVVSVRRATTKYGKPYAFVNFGDWRRDCFKLTVWSEGLETFRKPPTEAWAGRWVSATGLLDEPFENERFGNTQLSITIQDASQVRLIDEAEALHRLGRSPRASVGATPGTRTISGQAARSAAQAGKAAKPSNEELLRNLGAAPGEGKAPTSRPPTPARASGGSVPSPTPPPSPPARGSSGCLIYILIGIGALIFSFLKGLL